DSLEFSEPLASEREEAGSFAQSSARIEESLSEADFYLEQGLMDGAERLYQKVLKAVPAHPKAQLRLGGIEARRAKGGGKAAAAKARKAEPAKLEGDPLGDTMVRDPDGDEAISLPELPEDLVAPARKEKLAAARPTPVIAKPAPKVTPKVKPALAKLERTVVAEETVPPLVADPEPPEDLP